MSREEEVKKLEEKVKKFCKKLEQDLLAKIDDAEKTTPKETKPANETSIQK